MYKYYTGIGSRKTPENILKKFKDIATFLETKQYILRSGGADGADSAFESGVINEDNKRIFLPWKGFNGNKSRYYIPPNHIDEKSWRIKYPFFDKVYNLAEEYHRNWKHLTPPVKRLQARNGLQVFGERLNNPSDFVICYAPLNNLGGTGQAIRIAIANNISVYNFANDTDIIKFMEFKNAIR